LGQVLVGGSSTESFAEWFDASKRKRGPEIMDCRKKFIGPENWGRKKRVWEDHHWHRSKSTKKRRGT